jgi:hypothetical protein
MSKRPTPSFKRRSLTALALTMAAVQGVLEWWALQRKA